MPSAWPTVYKIKTRELINRILHHSFLFMAQVSKGLQRSGSNYESIFACIYQSQKSNMINTKSLVGHQACVRSNVKACMQMRVIATQLYSILKQFSCQWNSGREVETSGLGHTKCVVISQSSFQGKCLLKVSSKMVVLLSHKKWLEMRPAEVRSKLFTCDASPPEGDGLCSLETYKYASTTPFFRARVVDKMFVQIRNCFYGAS